MMVPDIMLEAYKLEEKLPMDYAPRKVAVPAGGEHREAVVVKKHHLDTNHHVNNQKFIDIAMDYLPEDFCIGQVRAEYKKQAYLDDKLIPCVVAENDKYVVVLEDEAGAPYVVTEFLRKGTE